MAGITCKQDVLNAFPGINFGVDKVQGRVEALMLDFDAAADKHIIVGELSADQILALGYWVTHRRDFR